MPIPIQLTPAQIQAIENRVDELIKANKLLKPATIKALKSASILKKQAIIPKLENMLKFQKQKTLDYLKKNPNALAKIKHKKIVKNIQKLHQKEAISNKQEYKILQEIEKELKAIKIIDKSKSQSQSQSTSIYNRKYYFIKIIIIILIFIIFFYIIWQKNALFDY